MAEQTAISWADATLAGVGIAPKLRFVGKAVTCLAQCHAVPFLRAVLRKFREGSYVMSVDVAASVIATVATPKLIAQKHIVPPLLHRRRCSLPAPLYAQAINEAGRIFPARGAQSGFGTYLSAGLQRMFFADPIARARLGRGAHLRATFVRHFFASSHALNFTGNGHG